MTRIQTILCGLYGENAYLLYRDSARQAVLIDPGDDLEALTQAIAASGKALGAILLTHGHFDHMLAAQPLKARFNCPVYIHAQDGPYLSNPALNCYDKRASRLPFVPFQADELLRPAPAGSPLTVAGYGFVVYHTPGHTPGSVCYQLEAEKALFTGDTLFAQGYGRMDLPGGSEGDMAVSLRRLLAMPRDLILYPGHGASASLGQAGDMLW
ncbi:MAG TPA: MBL fold metallo-hydrolase [Candidatus Excrementavichristensenella intestinipullorum]|nr:MBL fold metallo-hydrolase [Candidatus Excrementavichristensenella intestinipullorum]